MTNTPENKSVPCKGSEEKVTPFLSDLTPRITGELASTLLQRIEQIAGDFVPSNDREAPLALQEMRDALMTLVTEHEKELGACSLSRATIGDRTHDDRRPQDSNRRPGEEEQRGREAERCDATRASGAELGARGGNAAQHEVERGAAPSTSGAASPDVKAPAHQKTPGA